MFFTLSGVTIGFEKAVYTVEEAETGSFVEVCAVMRDATPQDCLVDFEFNIIFFTLDGSARAYSIALCHCVNKSNFTS